MFRRSTTRNRQAQSGNVVSSAGDALIAAEDVKSTLDGNSFTISIDESSSMGADSSLTIACVYDDERDVLEASVTSRFKGAETVDTYELSR